MIFNVKEVSLKQKPPHHHLRLGILAFDPAHIITPRLRIMDISHGYKRIVMVRWCLLFVSWNQDFPKIKQNRCSGNIGWGLFLAVQVVGWRRL